MKKSLILLFCLFSLNSSAKIGLGFGFDLSPNAARISLRNWFNKTSGFEIGFGPTANFEDFIFNDFSIQGKYMVGFKYNGYTRTYAGGIARYTVLKDPFFKKNIPSLGLFIGNEWYIGKYRNHGVSMEGGLMYGRISRKAYVIGPNVTIDKYYKEFPFYLCFSYKFYMK
jgi:hypothetical protein